MALVLADRVKESTTTTGTGTVNLAGAETGFQTFVAGVGNSNTTYYAIVDNTTGAFEVGIGTVTDASPDTLSRATILQSSNSDSAVDFAAGTKDVFCTFPADKAVFEDASGNISIPGTIDGRDLATDGTKLDGVEASADVTDTANVTSAGALMDSEVTNLAQVKAFDSSDYATAAQGATADAALPKAGGTMTGVLDFGSVTGRVITITADNDLNSADASIYLGNAVQNQGFDIEYEGSGSGNANAFVITSTNSGSPKEVLRANQDGIAKFPNGTEVTGNITVTGTVDGRDLATDGTKLDGIEASADVTDATNVTAAGALMDSEVTNLAQVKAFASSDYATAAQGTTADAALPKAGGTMTGSLTISGDNNRINLPNDHFINFRFEMDNADNNGVAYVLLCRNAANNDVNGRITMDRTSGLLHACQVDIIVSSGNSTLPIGSLKAHGVSVGSGSSPNGPSYELVTVTYDSDSNSYVALKITNPDSFYETAGAFFTGRAVNSGSNFLVVTPASGISSEAQLNDTNAKHTFQGDLDLLDNIVIAGTVDGRDVAADGATADAALPKAGGTMTGNIVLGDNIQTQYGAGTDLTIVHNGTNSQITNNSGNLQIVQNVNDSSVIIYSDDSSGGIAEYFQANGATGEAILFHYGTEKIKTQSGGVAVTGLLSATTKSFVIDHPTKSGHKLRHGSLEGPENGVYVRGQTQENVILLPDYWVGLVDKDSITVTITPIGKDQGIYVESWDVSRVVLSGTAINCFYTVYAERKDVEPFEVEYMA